MVREIRIYYEGDKSLRQGFDQFLDPLRKEVRSRPWEFRVISGGSGSNTCEDFARALRSHPDTWNILLIDSEGPDTGDLPEALCRKHGWDVAHADSIFWMVEMMESWFHADRESLKNYYGSKFRENALTRNPDVETISKADLKNGLSAATKDTGKGNYFDHKAQHSRELLARIDPVKVQQAAPNCKRLFIAVRFRVNRRYPIK